MDFDTIPCPPPTPIPTERDRLLKLAYLTPLPPAPRQPSNVPGYEYLEGVAQC